MLEAGKIKSYKMRLILVSSFCLVAIVGVQAVNWNLFFCTLGTLCSTEDGALIEASELLDSNDKDRGKDKDISVDYLESKFARAKEVLRELDAADSHVIEILRALLQLESLSPNRANVGPQCTTAEIDNLIGMKKLIQANSIRPGMDYSELTISRLSLFIHSHFIESCSKRIQSQIEKFKSSDSLIDGLSPAKIFEKMSYFSIFLGEGTRKTAYYMRAVDLELYKERLEDKKNWQELLGRVKPAEKELKTLNDLNGLFNNLFETTCGLIDKQDSLRETFELGSKMLHEYLSGPPIFNRFGYEFSIGDYLICKAAKDHYYRELSESKINNKRRT